MNFCWLCARDRIRRYAGVCAEPEVAGFAAICAAAVILMVLALLGVLS